MQNKANIFRAICVFLSTPRLSLGLTVANRPPNDITVNE